ncbi:hypothetical protein TEA_012055 [Camellia sinensis var. sinensis]|uniref:Uncharacterized protein n=1 Tax=Camellia sinensis var. sinensis TaxID=542762 RepID=A0A4S4E7K6_CAMSN|nr:hypothetical protein TEA_012055 [Camellia sinensis var. sinensis]
MNADEQYNKPKSSYFNLPALDVSLAFPQATPASLFPPCTSDYYQFDDLLTPEEQSIRMKVREYMEKEIAPIMAKYWEKAEFPFHVVPKLGALGIAGGTIKGYGCPGLSITASAITVAELARVDASCSTFVLVHSALAMLTIACNSVLLFTHQGLTEPDYGSDASSLKTTATKVSGGWICWIIPCELPLENPLSPPNGSGSPTLPTPLESGRGILEGQKRWIGNSTFADVLVIFARNTTTNQINAFLVKKDAPGLQATKIENKIGLRIVQNGDILFKKVFVPDEDKLPGLCCFTSHGCLATYWHFNGCLRCVTGMLAWGDDLTNVQLFSCTLCPLVKIKLRIQVKLVEKKQAMEYLKERKQFGAPLADFQLTQQKLVQMLGNIQAMILIGWRLCKMYEKGTMTMGHVSLGKAWITSKGRETVSLGRELLGGNGILTDFLVAKAFCDLEPIYTFEGTYDINTLVTGREITGIASFKPSASTQQSRL